MTGAQLRVLALITSAQARIAGMQADNQHRLSVGDSVAYHGSDFFHVASELEQLATEVANS